MTALHVPSPVAKQSEQSTNAGRGLPLERKLPLLIFGVLATALAISLGLSYYEVRRSAEQSAADRLSGLSRVFATLVEQQMNNRLALMRRISRDTAVIAALRTPARATSPAVRKALAGLIITPADSVMPGQLWTPDGRLVAGGEGAAQSRRAPSAAIRLETPSDSEHLRDGLSGLTGAADSQHIGRIYTSNGRSLFWIAVPIRARADKGVVGYVVQQRRINTDPRALRPLRDLIGPDIEFYLRNAGDRTWVQLTGAPQAPPTRVEPFHDSLKILTLSARDPVLASTATISGTPFLITVDEPMGSILAGPQGTIRALAVIAMILIVIGAAIAWVISRRMARPLVELTAAVEAMAQGRYSQRVHEAGAKNGTGPRPDEIARLTTAFNRMASQVQESSEASSRAVDRLTRSVATQEFLAEASRIVAGSLSDESLLAELARFCVPTIADYCSIHIAQDDGEIRRVVTEHDDHAKEGVADELFRRSGFSVDDPSEVATVIRSRKPLLIPSLEIPSIRTAAVDATAVGLLEEIRPRSFMAVPLVARGRAFGAMTFGMTDSGRTLGPDDLDLAVELGRRTAAAIDNALIYRHSIALRLEAEAASNAKSDFLAKMSHEIRTPINAMMGYAELLEMGISGPVSEAQAKHLARIRASGDHLTSLVDEILDLAKIEAGRMAVQTAIAVVGEAADAALALIRPLASAQGVELRPTIDGDSRTRYIGDPQRVQQILTNLLSNAVKFTPPGGSVSMACGTGGRPGSTSSEATTWTYIAVADSGVGIAEDDLERIFHPFVQVDDGYTRSHGGTGLGLTISRTLAQMMGGDISVESVVGRGSRFVLWLPAPNS